MSAIGGQSSFAAHPRVVNQKAKFKDPYGLNQEEYVPSNIMFDKRVYRGSTNAAMVIPAGTYPDNLFQNQKQTNAQMKQQQRAQAAEEFFTRDIRTPEAPAGRQNIDIQTDQFVEELTDKAPCYEIAIQTMFKIDRPQTPRSIPIKTGVDKKTLVQDNELFIFDNDVEPILSVLCGKTLELARMEVLEEEELREMRSQQKQFTEIRNAELAEIQRMENAEIKKRQEFDKKKTQEKEKKKQRIFAHKKIVSRQIAKQYIKDSKSNTMRFLFDVGFFVDQFKTDVMEGDVLPWLEQQVISEVQKLEEYNKQPNEWIGDYIDDVHEEHKKTVQAEHDRKLKVKLEQEAAEQAKLEEKRRRRAAKEAKRKAEELQRLREEIKVNFIDKGQQQEGILAQDLIEINGNKEATPIVGCLGGLLGQLIIVFNSIIKNFDKDNNIASNDVVQNYIHQFVLEKLKTEKMHQIVGKAVENFLNGLEKPMQLNEMRVMKEPNYSKFREILRDTQQQGDPVLQLIMNNLETLGISKDNFNLVFDGFWDLYCKKPQSQDLNAKKLDGWINKVKLVVPAGGSAAGDDGANAGSEEVQDLPLKAIVRVRIPLKRPEPEQNDDVDGDNDDKSQLDANKQDSQKDNSVPPTPLNKDEEEKTEEVLEEQDLEDKVTKIATQGETYQVFVMHQAAMRLLRQDIVKDMRRNIEALDSMDDQELLTLVDKEAIEVENKFLELYSKVPQEDKQVPVFDFELF